MLLHLLILSMTALGVNCLFFNAGGGCGCRPQQCSCAAPLPPPRSYCPPSPCFNRPLPAYQPQYVSPIAYRPPPPPMLQQSYYTVPEPIPIQTQFQSSYQIPPSFTSSYNAPSSSSSSSTYSTSRNSIQNAPIEVASAKETGAETIDTVIQKSKTVTQEKNDLDLDVNALSNFESTLQAYKSMNVNGIRRAQRAKTEQPEKCSSTRLREIMEEVGDKSRQKQRALRV